MLTSCSPMTSVGILRPGELSYQTEPCRPSGVGVPGPVNRLAQELGQALGCPVEVTYKEETREVVAVARPKSGREVRVVLPVSPIALPLMENPFAAVKYNLLKQ